MSHFLLESTLHTTFERELRLYLSNNSIIGRVKEEAERLSYLFLKMRKNEDI
jgi:hypothetical protein